MQGLIAPGRGIMTGDSEELEMPIYEYVCNDCGQEYERIVMGKGNAITCPKCASAKHTLKLSVFAAPAGSGKSSSGPSSGFNPGGGCCGGSCGCH